MANAEIISIGSELLLGQIVDTNASWMAQRLTDAGVNLFYKTVVGDNPGRMREVIEQALERSDIVITGGGIGPTQDDLTREIVADATGRELMLDPHLSEQIEQRFQRRGLIMTENNQRQAYIPRGAIPVENPNGTAPSFIVEDPRGVVFALPGVPFEMKWLFDNEVIPYLQRKFSLSETLTYRVLKVAEIGESSVDDRIGHLIAGSSNPTVGVLAHPGQVDVRIAAKAATVEDARSLIAPMEDEVRKLLGRHVFAADDETMEDAVGGLLRGRNATVAVYEDITAGLVTERLQQASHEHFAEAVVGGGTRSMRRLLAPSSSASDIETLLKDPAELSKALARAVRDVAGSTIGLALHAIPEQGTSGSEVENLARGQTHVAVADGSGFRTRTYSYARRGRPDRTRMSLNAIEVLRTALLEGFPE